MARSAGGRRRSTAVAGYSASSRFSTLCPEARTRRIEAEGYRVIRFWNNDVNDALDGVLIQIAEALAESAEAHPQPHPQAGGESQL